MARKLMFQGTGSDVGKTVLVAGLCRAAVNRGMSVRPFKPQNMSNNAAVAQADNDQQGEIGRGQWLQAFACKTEPTVHMNPVLLKPQSDVGSQIVVQGSVWGSAKAREYSQVKPKLMDAVIESFERVSSEAELVLVEGAGSPAEVNLRQGDIANMGFASRADVPVVLIGDVDRGGVIASLVGTHTILPKDDRDLIAGFVINKFRGDLSLFDDGLTTIIDHTGWPSFGVLPWVDAAKALPAEDSVALDRLASNQSGGVSIVVPAMGKIANFDDLDALAAEPNVSVRFIRKGDPFPDDADMIVLPGSKSTIADLQELRANGWEAPIKAFAKRGGLVMGICGGYQMLGRKIFDPDGIESSIGEIDGLGLLDVVTTMKPEKQVKTSSARALDFDCPVDGYEIHAGETIGQDCDNAMIDLGYRMDGAINRVGNVKGCYLHGLFGSQAYRAAFLKEFGVDGGLASYSTMIDDALDALAEDIEKHLDVDGLFALAR